MKKLFTILAITISAISFSQTKLSYVTLSVHLTQVTGFDGINYSSQWVAYYGISGCPYVYEQPSAQGSTYTGFVYYSNLTVKSPTTDAVNFTKIATDSADAYRKRTYPDVK